MRPFTAAANCSAAQAINLLMTFGMSVVLSLWAPTTAFLWRYLLAHMLSASLQQHSPASLQGC
jgi:hypothetical protein